MKACVLLLVSVHHIVCLSGRTVNVDNLMYIKEDLIIPHVSNTQGFIWVGGGGGHLGSYV